MLACLAAVPCFQDPAPRAGEGASFQNGLETVAHDFAQALFARYPWLAVERGFEPESPLGLGVWRPEEMRAWRDRLQRLEVRLEALPASKLPPLVAVELDGLASAIEVETILDDVYREDRWNPLEWVQRVDRALRIQLFRSDGRSARGEIEAILSGIPEFWEQARMTLAAPPDPWRTEAAASLAELKVVLTEIAAEASDGPSHEYLISRALEGTQRFHAWLTGISPTPPQRSAMGETHWFDLVEAACGYAGNVRELEALLLGDLAGLERLHRGLGTTLEPSDSAAANFETLALEVCTTVWNERVGPLLGEEKPLELVFRRSDLPSRLGRSSILLSNARAFPELLVDPSLLSRSSEAGLRCLALRLGVPGEALLVLRARSVPGAGPRFLWNRSLLEGWGCLALEDALHGNDPEVATHVAQMLELEAARLLATLDLHASGLALPRVAERFARRSGFVLDRSLAEVRASLDDPLRGIGYLGYRELARLKRSFANEPGRFLGSVLSHPHLRPADLARALAVR